METQNQVPSSVAALPRETVGRYAPSRWERRSAPTTWEEFSDGAKAWVEEHWIAAADHTCPYCGHNQWSLGAVLALPTAPRWPLLPESGPGIYPVFQVICATCGQVALVSALWPFEAQDKPEPPDAPSQES
jgi:hypothetical protein